jgi:DNA-binding response OmpR family regulator
MSCFRQLRKIQASESLQGLAGDRFAAERRAGAGRQAHGFAPWGPGHYHPGMRIAILEDDPDQLALLQRWLVQDGHDVHGYKTGREAMMRATRESFDLFVLDWQVPDVSGVEVLQWVRNNVSQSVPILFVTVRDSEQDIVLALESGADDYMIKPARQHELLARVHALLRRAYPHEDDKLLSFPPFDVDIKRGEIRRAGAKIELTPKEYELAVILFRNIGRLMSRGHLQESIWGRSGELATRTVDTHVSQVRKKLDLRAESGYRVVPVYNYGYRLEQCEPAS